MRERGREGGVRKRDVGGGGGKKRAKLTQAKNIIGSVAAGSRNGETKKSALRTDYEDKRWGNFFL